MPFYDNEHPDARVSLGERVKRARRRQRRLRLAGIFLAAAVAGAVWVGAARAAEAGERGCGCERRVERHHGPKRHGDKPRHHSGHGKRHGRHKAHKDHGHKRHGHGKPERPRKCKPRPERPDKPHKPRPPKPTPQPPVDQPTPPKPPVVPQRPTPSPVLGTATDQARTPTVSRRPSPKEDTPTATTRSPQTQPLGELPFTGPEHPFGMTDLQWALALSSLAMFAVGVTALALSYRRASQVSLAVRAVDRALRARYTGPRERL